RSRGAVHQPGVHGAAGGYGHRDQHGWSRPSPRQRVHRAALANCEVREHLPAWLRDGGGVGVRLGVVLRLLLIRTAAHGARLPHAVGGVFGGATLAAGEMKTLRRKKFWPAARLSRIVNLDPIRVRSSAATRDLGRVSRAVKAHLNQPQKLSNDWGPPHYGE